MILLFAAQNFVLPQNHDLGYQYESYTNRARSGRARFRDRSVINETEPTEISGFTDSAHHKVIPLNIRIRRSANRGLRSALDEQTCAGFAPITNRVRGWRVVGAWLFLVTIAQLFAPNAQRVAHAQQATRIIGVQVEGNATIVRDAILQKTRTNPNRPVNPQQIREDIRRLYNTRWFSAVDSELRETPNGTVLVFHVRERPIVRRVTYIGNQKIKRELLDSWTGLRVGSAMDASANREAVRQIKRRYEEKGFRFTEVRLEKGGDPGDREVVIRINEGPKVYVYRRNIVGSKFVSASRLKTKLATKAAVLGLPVMSIGLYNPDTLQADIDNLKQYYQALGFFDVAVEATPNFSPDKAWVTVQYNVNEGKRYQIRNIVYEGNAAIPAARLGKSRELREGDFFNARFVNKDVSNMLNQYDERGHYFAQVQPVPRFLEEEGIVDLVYEIDEDRIRYLRRINVHLVNEHSNTKETVVLDRSPMAPGDPVSRIKLRRFQGRLASSGIFEPGPTGVRVDVKPVGGARTIAFGTPPSSVMRGQNADRKQKRGFGHTINPSVNPLKSPKPGRIHRTASPQKQHFVDPGNPEVLFRGQSPPVFRGQSPQTYGPPVAAPDIRGQNFDPYNPLYDNNPQGDPFGRQLTIPQPGYVDVDVFANEGRTGRLTFGGGVNSDAGIVGQFTYDESNFDLFRPPTSWGDIVDGRAWRGGGQRFRVEAIPGDQVSRYAVSWTDPYFLYSDYSLSVSGSLFNRFFPDWTERRGGGRISIGRAITPEWSVTGTIRLEEVRIRNAAGDPGPPPILEQAVGSSFLSTGRVTMSHDTRDSSVLPSEGHFAQASYEQAFGDFNYPRFEGEWRQFHTLFSRPDGSGRHVVSFVGQLGWSGDDTPVFERFYAGGFQSFRGFSFRGVGPVENSVSIGGNWMALGSAEYRFPLVASDALQGVLFTDFGTVEEDVNFNAFRLTVGGGIRVTIPQLGAVPLAFDFGFPLLSQEGDDERIFSFYVSAAR